MVLLHPQQRTCKRTANWENQQTIVPGNKKDRRYTHHLYTKNEIRRVDSKNPLNNIFFVIREGKKLVPTKKKSSTLYNEKGDIISTQNSNMRGSNARPWHRFEWYTLSQDGVLIRTNTSKIDDVQSQEKHDFYTIESFNNVQQYHVCAGKGLWTWWKGLPPRVSAPFLWPRNLSPDGLFSPPPPSSLSFALGPVLSPMTPGGVT